MDESMPEHTDYLKRFVSQPGRKKYLGDLIDRLFPSVAFGLKAAVAMQGVSVEEWWLDVVEQAAARAQEQLDQMPQHEREQFLFKLSRLTKHGTPIREAFHGTAHEAAYARTLKRKSAFLIAYEQCGNVGEACRLVDGIYTSTLYYWARSDISFLERWNDLRRQFNQPEYPDGVS